MNRGFSINFVQNFQQIPPVECHLRVFLNTTCWGDKIKHWNPVAVPFVSLWLTRPTCTWGTVSGKISYFGFYSVRSGCCVHLLSPRSLRWLVQLKYISIICFQSLNCSFLFFVSLCTNRSTGWNFDTNQDDLSVFASESFPRQRRKDSISPPCFRSDSEARLLSSVGKVISPCRFMCFIATSCCYKFII